MYSVWVSWHDMFCIFLDAEVPCHVIFFRGTLQMTRDLCIFLPFSLCKWHGSLRFLGVSDNSHVICRYYIYLSLSLSLSVCLSVCLSPVYLQAWKGSCSARRPQVLNLTTAKTQQFCETSSLFEVDNVKNEAILRDILNFWTWKRQKQRILRHFLIFRSWQHQKRSNSARLRSKMESWAQRWQPRTIAFCDFSTPPV